MHDITRRRCRVLIILIVAIVLCSCWLSFALADTPNIDAAHLLRRFAFSASPEEMSAVITGRGSLAWLDEQLTPRAIDDSALLARLEAKPSRTNAKGVLDDEDVYERRLFEREVYSKRQVQEKLVLHWLEHFSVGVSKVGDWPLMGRYEETLRAQALGNFSTMLGALAKDGAMLLWLDNNYNDSAGAVAPNENFARELLQLYVMGTDRLNPDGSIMLDAHGNALKNYTQADVRELAIALSGWGLDCNDEERVKDPNTRCARSYHRELHRTGTRHLLGWSMPDDGSPRTLDAVIAKLARHPSTAPFQAKELLQRFVTEEPSPAYVGAIARVWQQNAGAPDQIAKVVRAIVVNPEFAASAHQLMKEPVEALVDAMRVLPSDLRTAKNEDGKVPPGASFVQDGGFLQNCGQQLYDPPSVFSFYRPGHKADLFTDQFAAARFAALGALATAELSDPTTDAAFDFDALLERIGSSDPQAAALYLTRALTVKDVPPLRTAVAAYLKAGVDTDHLRGAVWLILTSPEYEVN